MVVIGFTLARKLRLAISEQAKQTEDFKEINALITDRDRGEWSTMYDAWYDDNSRPSPFAPRVKGMYSTCQSTTS